MYEPLLPQSTTASGNNARQNAGLTLAARTLAQLGRMESEAYILREIARVEPTMDNLHAWLDSAQCVHDHSSASEALTALEDAASSTVGEADQLQTLGDRRMRLLRTRSGAVPRVAGIMDEFTTASFRPECVFLPLLPDTATRQLEHFKPDFVFVESAWHGNNQAWSRLVSTVSDPLRRVLTWCKENDVPSIFWNKEDPVHYSSFLPAAALCDYVFTTDMDCIPSYKDALGHDRIFLLPFAAQPQQHNPIVTMERKDAFNFAGSYYLRYPERQRDIAAILDTVKEFRPVDIYDRNHDNNHPHYKFPPEYQSMILGKLPFSEIAKAYKGYSYGINMNTIKQSQTMFARRVYELMASNTVVVSNFSRGVRMLFGDLVICSDNREQLASRLATLATDDLHYRKFRLQGLRKVMREHTYAARLDYIMAKIRGETYRPQELGVLVVAHAQNQVEADTLIAAFKRQTYENKNLVLLAGPSVSPAEAAGLTVFRDSAELIDHVLGAADDFSFWGVMHVGDYYGANYLTDLTITARYSDAEGFGKACHYRAEDGSAILCEESRRYRETDNLPLRASLISSARLERNILECGLRKPTTACVEGHSLMGIDEFNYCRNGAVIPEVGALVDDIYLPRQGLSSTALYAASESMAPAKTRLRLRREAQPVLSAKKFYDQGLISKSTPLIKKMVGNTLEISNEEDNDRPAYFWIKAKMPRKSLGLIDQSTLSFEMEHDFKQAQLVCEFYKADNTKISHSMLGTGGDHSLALPRDCTQLRFGLRVIGRGSARISDITFGTDGNMPPALVGPSKTLVLTKQYPAYDDLYKYGFLHSRVRAYRESGVEVDVFRMNSADKTYSEFENVDVASGDDELLKATLKTGQYEKVCVHMLDPQMWKILKDHLEHVSVTIWIHGAEIQHWKRREYEFVRMTDEEIIRKKRRTASYLNLWREVFENDSGNVHMVFVSNSLLQEATEDVGIAPREGSFSVIHNYVDGNAFAYQEKTSQHRLKILSIRPYMGLKYANDLSAAAIVELSKRPFFHDLEFYIAGQGPDFEAETASIREFPNVTLRNDFLSHSEIAALHKRFGVFLNPTRWDSQGVSRDEAMASGLVPVTSRSSAVPEFVDDSCGFMAPENDYIQLADAIETLYNGPELFFGMSKAAAKRVREQSGWQRTIKEELALIEPSL